MGIAPLVPLISLLVYALIGYAAYRFWRGRVSRAADDTLQPAGDATRYALAAAVLEGSHFRRRIIDLCSHRYRAKAPELGLDLPLVLAACKRFEREDAIYNWIICLFALLCVPWVLAYSMGFEAYQMVGEFPFSNPPYPLLVLLLILAFKGVRDLRRVAPFRRESYDLQNLRREFLGPAWAAASNPENVVCYGTRHPFVGLGYQVDAWQVAIELDRRVEGAAANGHAAGASVSVADLLSRVDEAVRGLNLSNLDMRFPLFVSGTEVAQIPSLLENKYSQPNRLADGETLGRFWYLSDPRARSYRWYVINDWNGELVFSYLLRIVQRGRSLAFETVQLILPPIDSKYRRIDTLPSAGIPAAIGAVVLALVRSPLTVLGAFGGAARSLLQLVGISGRIDREERREIARNPAFNYGARMSIRQYMAAPNYHVYFQQVDGRQYFKTIDQRVLNTICDTLRDAGIDIAGLVGQAQTIINNSTNITGNNNTLASGNFGTGAVIGTGATGMSGLAGAAARAVSTASGKVTP